jgi:hypothetical protein
MFGRSVGPLGCVSVNGILYPLVSTLDPDVYCTTPAVELESGVDRDPFEVLVGRGDLSGY